LAMAPKGNKFLKRSGKKFVSHDATSSAKPITMERLPASLFMKANI